MPCLSCSKRDETHRSFLSGRWCKLRHPRAVGQNLETNIYWKGQRQHFRAGLANGRLYGMPSLWYLSLHVVNQHCPCLVDPSICTQLVSTRGHECRMCHRCKRYQPSQRGHKGPRNGESHQFLWPRPTCEIGEQRARCARAGCLLWAKCSRLCQSGILSKFLLHTRSSSMGWWTGKGTSKNLCKNKCWAKIERRNWTQSHPIEAKKLRAEPIFRQENPGEAWSILM